ncbi:MAG: growth inhibitor PemK [Gammaproteobacteria bacterium RIFCSPHIGHO2_02_FULL_39_13]|nr:MAG: growth inhibitor PemK [Gammaproteobacteria bacterium RIFCSPHIGHO2_02_FULL_39_13]OGT49664.1 MAG: growth inhibitor PemK [Gammaproteobacteria bacterium RIFCSPHIGHO2_12_FULL_39_24]
MSKYINRGDVYWIDPNPTSGRELKDRHRFVVITTKEVNQFGIVTTVPITSGGNFARSTGFALPITGHDTTGVALCNQVRSFDIAARVKAGTAKYIETLDQSLAETIVDRVISIIDPDELR